MGGWGGGVGTRVLFYSLFRGRRGIKPAGESCRALMGRSTAEDEEAAPAFSRLFFLFFFFPFSFPHTQQCLQIALYSPNTYLRYIYTLNK